MKIYEFNSFEEFERATADRDRIAEELRELKNKLFHLSLVIA